MTFRGATYATALLMGVGCAPNSGKPVELTMEQLKEKGRVQLPLLVAEGVASRSVRTEGIAALARFLSPDAVLLWPGSAPRLGFQSIEFGLSQNSWADSSQIFWQPMIVRVAPGLGLVAGVMTASGPAVHGGELEIGRYLAAWRLDSTASRLAALAISQLPLTPLETPVFPVASTPDSLPTGIRQADLAFRTQLSNEGTAAAFRDWFAPDGVTFGAAGILAFGPEEVSERVQTPGALSKATMTPAAWGSSQDSALAWVAGAADISATLASGEVNDTHWNYLLFWERQPSGEYRILAAITNPGPRDSIR